MRGCSGEHQIRHLARRWWAFCGIKGETSLEALWRRLCSSHSRGQLGGRRSGLPHAPCSSPALLAPFLAAPLYTSPPLPLLGSTRGLGHLSQPHHAPMAQGGVVSLTTFLYPTPSCHVIRVAAFHASARCCGGDGVEIPVDRLTITFVRSSGPGGQNVNKLNTKAELRFHVPTADWIPEPVRNRLMEQQKHRINRAGDLIITSQDHRTQARNRDECLYKLEDFLDQAFPEPKVRKIKEGISDHTKAVRREAKRHRSDIKANRRGGGDD